MSEIKVNSIKGVGASTAAITVNNTDGTCTANLTNRTNKNLIINGAMQVAQRGTSSTSSGYQTVDRFVVNYGGTDEAPTQAQVDVASGTSPYTSGFRKALKITNGNQTSGAGATDSVNFGHKLEAQDIANSGWNYTSTSSFITLSFWVKSSVAQVFYGYLQTRDGSEYSYPFSTGSLSADTWTKVTKTIPGNSNLQFDNNNGSGLEFYINGFLGTDYTDNSRSLDSWAAQSDATHFPDMTSTWYTTNDATLEFTGLQLEVSDHATDFEHRSFAQELALCQRYYYLHLSGTSKPVGMFVGFTSTGMYGMLQFPVTMRANPTFEQTTGTNYYRALYQGGGVDNFNSFDGIWTVSTTSVFIDAQSNDGLSISSKDAVFSDSSNASAKLAFTAEL